LTTSEPAGAAARADRRDQSNGLSTKEMFGWCRTQEMCSEAGGAEQVESQMGTEIFF